MLHITSQTRLSRARKISRRTSDRINLPSPVNVEALDRILEGYDHCSEEYVIQGFTSGFEVDFQSGTRRLPPPPGLHDGTGAFFGGFTIQKEVLAECLGPYPEQPYENIHVSPVSLRNKTQTFS